jgi:hypothetical protein
MTHKKILVAVITVLLLSFYNSHAQEKNTFDFGLKGGINFNKITSSGNILPFDYKTANSFLGGAFLRLNLGRIYIQPEGYFTGKRSEVAVVIQDADSSMIQLQDFVTITSFDIPLLLGYKLINDDKFNARIYAGPVFTSILSQKLGDLDVLNNGNYQFEKKSTGYQIGVGFDIGDLTIDGRYENSLTDWNNTYNQRIQLYQISVGFKIF